MRVMSVPESICDVTVRCVVVKVSKYDWRLGSMAVRVLSLQDD